MNIAVVDTEARPADIPEAEWAVRLDLAAAYRLVAHFDMNDLVYNHITAKVPGPEQHFLINDYGLHYEEITASSLVKVDLDGNVVDGSGREINPAGYVIHSCVHRAREDAMCVLHTHAAAGLAVSCLKEGFIPLDQAGLQFHNRLSYHDYEGMAVDAAEQERLVADLGPTNRAMILRNHGLLTLGRTVSEAFRTMYYLENCCRLQLEVMQTGREINHPARAVAEHTADQWDHAAAGIGGGDAPTKDWPAMLRLLDRKDPSWRT